MTPNTQSSQSDGGRLSIKNIRIRHMIASLPICQEWLHLNSNDELLEYIITDYVFHTEVVGSTKNELSSLREFIAQHEIINKLPVVQAIMKSEIESILLGRPIKEVVI